MPIRSYECPGCEYQWDELVNPNEDKFSVAIIRETYDRTNFNNLQVDSPVNVEFDIMAKYVERALNDK